MITIKPLTQQACKASLMVRLMKFSQTWELEGLLPEQSLSSDALRELSCLSQRILGGGQVLHKQT